MALQSEWLAGRGARAFVGENTSDPSTGQIPLRDLKTQPGSEDLLESPAMEPYLNLALAMMQHQDVGPATEEIAALPLENRYVWRVASALKWAFADFETLNVEVDRQTLSAEDRPRLLELLKHRPLQFCLFLSTLFGEKQMELLMISAIRNARAVGAQPDAREHR
jgi:hypothetical protein